MGIAKWEITLKLHSDDGDTKQDIVVGKSGEWESGEDSLTMNEMIAMDLGYLMRMLHGSGSMIGGKNTKEAVGAFSDVL